LKNTVKDLFPGKLAKNALKESETALQRYIASASPHDMKHVKSMTHLQFSPVTVKKMIKSMGIDVSGTHVESFIFLAAVLEYLMAEILEIAGNAVDNQKGTIEKWQIELAITGTGTWR
jgi:hypothetical protein